MEDYIVRIQSAVEGKPVYFGTGIVISGHEVLTARHVVSGESHLLLTGDGQQRCAGASDVECGGVSRTAAALQSAPQ